MADVKNVVMGGWKRRRFDKSVLLGGIGRLMEGILETGVYVTRDVSWNDRKTYEISDRGVSQDIQGVT